ASSPRARSCARATSGSRRWRSARVSSAGGSRSGRRQAPGPRSAWSCDTMAEAIRVLLADDHAVVREGLRAFLELQDGIEVVGEAADGREAIEAVEAQRPDVVLMDLVMPRVDGLAAMRILRDRVPSARVVVLTSFLDDDKLL